jgi:diamine N-acetyltransferase
MPDVTLRRLGATDHEQVRHLRPAPDQEHLVATVADSLAQVAADDALTAFAVYDASQRGLPEPGEPAVGFAVTEVVASVGFVLRLLVGADHQGRGYGRATLVELVRRLRLVPDVELVATSHREDNLAMARLCAELGFVPWKTPFTPPTGEVYLRLDPAVQPTP